jgi:diaminohydroxyphosphoribosylaminopyrimidine deaminase/5-amino-6-(5-phosphoribosylamino)uracil reductase
MVEECHRRWYAIVCLCSAHHPDFCSGFFLAEASDRKFMTQALALAQRARGKTSPNPMVGAVLIRNRRVIAEGFHRGKGRPHAEVVALRKAGRRARGSTVYVNLEPCCHTGCTGPCTEALIKAGVARVVYSAVDPNPQVNGKGDRRLRQAGVKVDKGLLRKEAEELNEAYYGFHRLGRPFVTLKLAQSVDGRIATMTGDSQWISSPASLKLAHQLRSENDAVMVGAGTVRADNPALTVRLVKGRNPYRIIVVGLRSLPAGSQVVKMNHDLRTILAAVPSIAKKIVRDSKLNGLTIWDIRADRSGRPDPVDLMDKAAAFGLQSILVEGGSALATSLLRAGLVDKIILVIAPKLIGEGKPFIGDLGIRKLSKAIRLKSVTVAQAGPDLVFVGYPEHGGL